MSYTALYRKFRPLKFNEMVGQEHITRTIKNQIISGRVGHAYLFNGGRGTGKTSAAKILARAVNCLDPQDGEPCNECEICKGALTGGLTDIVEMDAASNNSVEDIRGIRETVNFLPSVAKYRVYIIDEVHMLSTGAFNALLKTLEEPPAHVKFILATTEPQKLPATILSRCQRFDFKKISVDDVITRLEEICKESNIEITAEALKLIAVLSEGAMRDAISILERCIQDGETKITEDKIKELVGIPKLFQINKLSLALIENDLETTIQTTEEFINEGKDLNNILWEIIKYIKDILIFKVSKKLEIYSKEEIKEIENLSNKVTKERLINIIYGLSELENSLKWATQRQVIFQTGIMKLCTNIQVQNIEVNEVKNNVKKEEIKIKENHMQNIQEDPKEKKVEAKSQNNEIEQKSNKIETSKATTQGSKMANWRGVVNKLKEKGKVMLYTNLINTNAIELNDMTIGIEFRDGITAFGKTVIEKPENMQELIKLVSLEYGKEMRIKLVDNKEEKGDSTNSFNNIISELDIPIKIIEE